MAQGTKRWAWLFLASFMAGSTIWTTHFTAMLGYEPQIAHGFTPELTFLSLLIAIGATFAGMLVASLSGDGPLIEAGGALLGLGISAMHYTGMAAFTVQGEMVYDQTLVAASMILGAIFCAIAMNRIARPVTRYCRYGAVAAFVLAIALTHFTGMGAITVVPDAASIVPEMLLPDAMMVFGVSALMAMILMTGAAIHFIDLQTQNEAVDRYRHLALHDPLTGLPNREHLNHTLENWIAKPVDETAKLALLTIDLNRFKQVNDVHGHAAGDALLHSLSARLTAALNEGEFLARIGGDEFVAIKRDIYAKSDARAFAERLMAIVEHPFEHRGQPLSVGSATGISIMPDDARAADQLMVRSDLAMYRAKTQESGPICFYDRSMDESSRSRSVLAIALRQAVAKGELELYYQPQNDAATRDLLGFEALLRWHHPERGMVSPVEFIPIAEETGLICEIGEWVLRTACSEAAGWAEPYRISVNVAPLQLAQKNLPAVVHEALINSGLSPDRLELEITETGIIGDQTHALHVLRQLKGLGVRIAMDDYGTGYSSLATLKSFPFDKIKIDRSFIDGIETNAQSAAIVRATIILGSSLNIPVLAEGVESENHLSFLTSEGCAEVQGYFFGKPMPSSAIKAVCGVKHEAIERPADNQTRREREPSPAAAPAKANVA